MKPWILKAVGTAPEMGDHPKLGLCLPWKTQPEGRYEQKTDAWSESVMLDLQVRNFEFRMPLILRQNCKRKKNTHTQAFNSSRTPLPKKSNHCTGL
jgi:hypothetical protein